MIPSKFEFEHFKNFQSYYEQLGFQYIETPWVVSTSALDITKPLHADHSIDFLVASGEQSFLELLLARKLPDGKWQTMTPCYRYTDGNIDDGLHFSQFYKLELIINEQDSLIKGTKQLMELIDKITEKLNACGLKNRVIETEDEPRKCWTVVSYDIEIETKKGFVEFGSYGQRFHNRVGNWVYGTGLALPRFQYILENKI